MSVRQRESSLAHATSVQYIFFIAIKQIDGLEQLNVASYEFEIQTASLRVNAPYYGTDQLRPRHGLHSCCILHPLTDFWQKLEVLLGTSNDAFLDFRLLTRVSIAQTAKALKRFAYRAP